MDRFSLAVWGCEVEAQEGRSPYALALECVAEGRVVKAERLRKAAREAAQRKPLTWEEVWDARLYPKTRR